MHLVETGCRFRGSLVGVAGCGHLIQQMSDQQGPLQALEGQKDVPGQILAAAVPGGLAEYPGSQGKRSKGRIGGLVWGQLVRTER